MSQQKWKMKIFREIPRVQPHDQEELFLFYD